MKYGLDLYVIGSTAYTSLSEEEYHTLVRAKRHLFLMTLIEEQFDLLLGNYLELEDALLSMATRWMVSIWPDYEYMQRERNYIVNRRFLNLVNACRGYLDHARHHFSTMQQHDQDAVPRCLDAFKGYTSEEYDKHVGYRVMEEMRNYTQHTGFPLGVTYDTNWVEEGDDRRLRYRAVPFVDVGRLEKQFKARVRAELEALEGRVEIMPMVRQYIASLANVHEKMRELLEPNIKEWEAKYRSMVEKFKEDHPTEKTLGLRAVKITDDGKIEEATELHIKTIEYRQTLERKNRDLGTLACRYVSSEGR